MAELDPRIPLGIRPFQLEGPMAQAQKALTLSGLIDQQRQRQQAMQEEAALKGVMQQTQGDPQKAIQALLAHGSPTSIALAAKLDGLIKRPQQGQSIGSGGLRLPDGTIIPPAARPDAGMKAPPMRERIEGDLLVKEEMQRDGTWKEIGRGPRFARQVAPTFIAPRPETPPVAVIGPDGKPTFVSRADAIGKTPASIDPSAQGALAGAKVTAREQAEREMNYPEATKQTKIAVEGIDSLKTSLKELRMHPGLPGITGAVYGRTPSVTKNSMAAQAIYENIVNNVFVNALQAMRAASKTGGAVGNVSDKEGDRLEQTLAALSRAQGTSDFQKQVNKAIERLDVAKKNIQEAYNSAYEYRTPKATGEWKVLR